MIAPARRHATKPTIKALLARLVNALRCSSKSGACLWIRREGRRSAPLCLAVGLGRATGRSRAATRRCDCAPGPRRCRSSA
jgi:hypothetical protein